MTATLISPAARVAQILDTPPVLSLQNVSKTYGDGEGTVTALHPSTLDVRAGELVAINGPSGSLSLIHI